MSFASIEFVGLFLPAVVIIYFAANRYLGATFGRCWLIAASLFFYASTDPKFLTVIAGSFAFNLLMARLISSAAQPLRKRYLVFGISANVLLLVFFKYAAFFLGNVASVTGWNIPVPQLGFPLGISFFTLQQIIFLMDCYERLSVPFKPLDHLLFLSFFPYITSGPLVHAKDLRSSFDSPESSRPNYDNIAAGIYLFAIGLFKKAVIADGIRQLADSGFDYTGTLTMLEAWSSSLAFTLQLYFDFSGYSDMAVGAGLMLNFTLPMNFNSPLKSTSIIEFWQRWHITLSSFITTYLYTPMLRAQSKVTFTKAMLITLISMTIAGLWHGPSWTYVVFGLVHGLGLVVNQIWKKKKLKLPKGLAWVLTFAFVNCAFVIFRANSLEQAFGIIHSMLAGPLFAATNAFADLSFGVRLQLAVIVLSAAALVWGFENSGRLKQIFSPSWRTVAFVMGTGITAIVFLNGVIGKGFVYREF